MTEDSKPQFDFEGDIPDLEEIQKKIDEADGVEKKGLMDALFKVAPDLLRDAPEIMSELKETISLGREAAGKLNSLLGTIKSHVDRGGDNERSGEESGS